MAYNKVILHGKIAREFTLNQTQGNVYFTNICVAVDRPFPKDADKHTTDFIECTAWGKTAEFICKYFSKGSGIIIDGSLLNNNYKDEQGFTHYSYTVRVDQVDFAERKPEKLDNLDNKNSEKNKKNIPEKYDDIPTPNFSELKNDEDLPF